MPKIPEHAKMRAFHGGYPDEPPHALEPTAAEREGAAAQPLTAGQRNSALLYASCMKADDETLRSWLCGYEATVVALELRLAGEMNRHEHEHSAWICAHQDMKRQLLAARRENETLRAQLAPCGECHLKPGERCDICGKVQHG
jgi:hypothetical protein